MRSVEGGEVLVRLRVERDMVRDRRVGLQHGVRMLVVLLLSVAGAGRGVVGGERRVEGARVQVTRGELGNSMDVMLRLDTCSSVGVGREGVAGAREDRAVHLLEVRELLSALGILVGRTFVRAVRPASSRSVVQRYI